MTQEVVVGPVADAEVMRSAVVRLQAAMLEVPHELRMPIDGMTRHYFADGAYAREMTIPAGVLVLGKIHKTEHVTIVSKGVVDVLDETGEVRRIEAPATFISRAGTQRAAFAHTETIWTVFHPTGERDLQKIEEQFIAKSFEEFQAFAASDQGRLLSAERF